MGTQTHKFWLEPQALARASDDDKQRIWDWIKDHGMNPDAVGRIGLDPRAKQAHFYLVTGVKDTYDDDGSPTPEFVLVDMPMPMKSKPPFVHLCEMQ